MKPEFPTDGADLRAMVNWVLLKKLAFEPHRLLGIDDDVEAQLRETPATWTAEVFLQARSAHHLLDLAGIPSTDGWVNDLDARTFLALHLIQQLRERLDRIAVWHCRQTADGGMVGDFCVDCGQRWPCDTRRMADGTYTDEAT